MIKIMFEKDRHYILFIIENRKVDTMINKIVLPYYPVNLQAVKDRITMSRNAIPSNMINLYALPKVDIDEFDSAKTDEEIKEIVIRDAKKQGAKLVDIKIE